MYEHWKRINVVMQKPCKEKLSMHDDRQNAIHERQKIVQWITSRLSLFDDSNMPYSQANAIHNVYNKTTHRSTR